MRHLDGTPKPLLLIVLPSCPPKEHARHNDQRFMQR
ncbi:hypothetical protein SAMN04490179_4633 [Pseudomonas antarctica]|uniref:Uncharacterized protein n=1 Tax=Pseudomonas antarctica TaxID=219572 RepID=A0A1H0C3J5_9PSED|nr:hypothetical protein PSAN_49710 [Pseudomonas antarctica]SDN52422.1 hypothetical protein SAMN04490179_4633 [Pseudomonas antarctica]